MVEFFRKFARNVFVAAQGTAGWLGWAGLGWAGLAAVVVCEAWLMLSNGLGPPPAQYLQCCSAAVTRGHAANTGPLFSQHASSLPSAGEGYQQDKI